MEYRLDFNPNHLLHPEFGVLHILYIECGNLEDSFCFSSVHVISPGGQPPNPRPSNIVATSHRRLYILKLAITVDN